LAVAAKLRETASKRVLSQDLQAVSLSEGQNLAKQFQEVFHGGFVSGILT
jgi:hypothetical protein